MRAYRSTRTHPLRESESVRPGPSPLVSLSGQRRISWRGNRADATSAVCLGSASRADKLLPSPRQVLTGLNLVSARERGQYRGHETNPRNAERIYPAMRTKVLSQSPRHIVVVWC